MVAEVLESHHSLPDSLAEVEEIMEEIFGNLEPFPERFRFHICSQTDHAEKGTIGFSWRGQLYPCLLDDVVNLDLVFFRLSLQAAQMGAEQCTLLLSGDNHRGFLTEMMGQTVGIRSALLSRLGEDSREPDWQIEVQEYVEEVYRVASERCASLQDGHGLKAVWEETLSRIIDLHAQ